MAPAPEAAAPCGEPEASAPLMKTVVGQPSRNFVGGCIEELLGRAERVQSRLPRRRLPSRLPVGF